MSSALRCILIFRNSKPVLQTANLNLSNSGSVLLNLSLQKSYSQLSRTNNGDGKFIRNPLTWCGNNILVRNFSSEDTSLPIPPKPVIGFDTSSPIPPKPEIGFDTSLPIPPKPEIGVDTSWPIPPKPEIEVDIAGEPSFESVGLGGYTPPGLIQQGLEHLHISCDLPWWQCIVIGTCLVRLVVFPVAIYAQKNMANLSNVMPHVMSVQNKMADARKRGNEIEAHQYARELTALLQEKKVNPLKNFLTPAIQMPVFISFFLALRGMVSLPIDSLHSGGALWFVDLTVPDPTYLLPLATSLTLMATIEVGLDTGMNPNQMPVYFKYIFRAMPFLMFPVIINFQGVILVYWLSTNFITLVQTSVLKVTAVRDFFGIPRVVPFKNEFQFPLPGLKPPEKPSFTQGLKESYSNIDKSYEIEERKRIDDLIKQQSLRAKAMESKSASTK